MNPPEKKIKKRRSKLGRGLSALVDQQIQTPGSPIRVEPLQRPVIFDHIDRGGEHFEATDRAHLREIEVARVVPNPHQPRRVFSDESLEELGRSIAEHGLMQPIVVRQVGDPLGNQVRHEPGGSADGPVETERYELIAGERRWRACCLIGQRQIAAMVLDVDERRSAQLALIENIQREELNPIERAHGFAALATRFSMTQEQIAAQVGIRRSSVANILRLIELDDKIQGMIGSGVLSGGHGKALLACKDDARRLALAEQASGEGWSVRKLEKVISSPEPKTQEKRGVGTDDGQRSRFESVLHDLENRLGEHLGTKVKLRTDRSGTKGRIMIQFYDLDHFDGLMSRLGIPNEHD